MFVSVNSIILFVSILLTIHFESPWLSVCHDLSYASFCTGHLVYLRSVRLFSCMHI